MPSACECVRERQQGGLVGRRGGCRPYQQRERVAVVPRPPQTLRLSQLKPGGGYFGSYPAPHIDVAVTRFGRRSLEFPLCQIDTAGLQEALAAIDGADPRETSRICLRGRKKTIAVPPMRAREMGT